ncbi:recombinase RecA [Spiroplasma endosymbiont of Amphibalanus improvisus]|uniref:recombinase RecA n=1 Tax=Spiroplasma endosymbiont of Amphibalanus improvisus TaxID=3066327 RepID=UPI003CC79EAD
MILKDIEKEYGKGSIMCLGESSILNVEALSSGSFLIDKAIGIGGYPKGRIVEIFGPESSGKTTLALHAIAQAQNQKGKKGVAAFIDAEHALDPTYAKKLGVNLNDLIISQPDSGEQALDILEHLVSSKIVDIVVVDSVAALVPKVELEGAMSDMTIGAQARLMSKALRKLNGIISRTHCLVIFINQIREKIGVMFGSPETTAGGRALRFYSSVRLDLRRIETISSNGQAISNKVKVKIVKNKVAPPFNVVNIEIKYDIGIDKISELISLAVEMDLIKKSGPWYSYEEKQIGQGKDKVKIFLQENPLIFKKIEDKINLELYKKN